MLALLSGYGYTRDDEAVVWKGLRGTDDEAGLWFTYDLSRHIILGLDMAYDNADTAIVHLAVKAPADLTDRIQLIDAIQSTFAQMEVE